MKTILAVVEKNEDGLKISRTAVFADLKEYHPKCKDCGHKKGIHGHEGEISVFCQVWNKIVPKEDYCSNYKM